MSNEEASELLGDAVVTPPSSDSSSPITKSVTLTPDMDVSKGFFPIIRNLLPDYDWDQLTRDEQVDFLKIILSGVAMFEVMEDKSKEPNEQELAALAADLQLARDTAEKIVNRWGPAPTGSEDDGENTKKEIERLLEECSAKAREILKENQDNIFDKIRILETRSIAQGSWTLTNEDLLNMAESLHSSSVNKSSTDQESLTCTSEDLKKTPVHGESPGS